jgi:epoxyqueuosine reductase
MPEPKDSPERTVLELAQECGFLEAGVAPVALPDEAERLQTWLERGYAGQMSWLERDREVRIDLRRRFPWVRSVIVVVAAYRTDPMAAARGISRHVSRYARGADYHDVLLERLERLAVSLGDAFDRPAMRWHPYVDTGPALERQLAVAAGLGWQGKNTLLLRAREGSEVFLGLLLTELSLPRRKPIRTSCGSCQACQPACPTGAFVEPGLLDARRCISYLTIEHRGPIERELRPAMGEWLFGCDLCQTACPFNHRSRSSPDPAWRASPSLTEIGLAQLLELDEEAFRSRFRRSPLWRPRREGLLRNALIVAANGAHVECLPAVIRLLTDPSPVLREGASWCLARLADLEDLPELEQALEREPERWVAEAMREDVARLRRRALR